MPQERKWAWRWSRATRYSEGTCRTRHLHTPLHVQLMYRPVLQLLNSELSLSTPDALPFFPGRRRKLCPSLTHTQHHVRRRPSLTQSIEDPSTGWVWFTRSFPDMDSCIHLQYNTSPHGYYLLMGIHSIHSHATRELSSTLHFASLSCDRCFTMLISENNMTFLCWPSLSKARG